MRPAMNSATATSSAAFMTVGAAPPVSMTRRARSMAGKRTGSWSSNVNWRTCARLRRAAAPVDALRPGQAMGDRRAHVRGAELGHHRAVAEFDHAVDHGLGMHQHVEFVGIEGEQMLGLDQFEALVHHGRRVDGDLGAHRPVGMLKRLLGGRRLDGVQRPGAERTAGGGQDHALEILARTGAERLEHGVVLGIDRQNGRTDRRRAAHEQPAGADQAFLVGERDGGAALDGRQRRFRPIAPLIAAITQSASRSAASTSAGFAGGRLDAGAGKRRLEFGDRRLRRRPPQGGRRLRARCSASGPALRPAVTASTR